MLTHPIAKALYSKFASSADGFTADNLTLAAKCALTVYRKVDRVEAQQFINMLRVIIADDRAAMMQALR